MMHWSDKYSRIPYVADGRDMRGIDCWGMVRIVLLEQKGIVLPSYGDISGYDLAAIATQVAADAADPEIWSDVVYPREFDVCVMRWYGKREDGHVGIMIDSHRVLHTEERTGTMIVPLEHHTIAGRIRYFRRHRSLVHEYA